MIFQAHEYEQLAKKPGSLQEFFDSTKGKFCDAEDDIGIYWMIGCPHWRIAEDHLIFLGDQPVHILQLNY